jgi:hypothetical protein
LEEVLNRRWLLPAVSLLTFGLAAPAQAAPLERDHYSGTDSFVGHDCGFEIQFEVTFEGVFLLKEPRSPGAPGYRLDNFEVHETLTANGRTLIIDHRGVFKDLRVTHVAGTIYQFVTLEAGQPFVVRDGEGNVLSRDRGALKVTYQMDTQGDTDPENDEFIEGSFEVLANNGPHPNFDVDLCPMLEDYFLG